MSQEPYTRSALLDAPGQERVDEELGAEPAVLGRSPGQLFWGRFKDDKFAFVGLAVILVMVVLALTAPLISRYVAGHDPNKPFVHTALDEYGLPSGPNSEFWFGADSAGRDLFVRTIYGARTSLIVAVGATGLSLVVGVVVGLVAGYYRGKVDTFLSRMTDVVMALPVLLLALGLAAGCGGTKEGCFGGLVKPGLGLVALIIGLFNWPYIARIVRGQVFSLREKEFIEAAKAQGAGDLRIMARDIAPNIVAPVIVYTTLIIPNNIIFEAALSFLGVGVPPGTPSWGKMLAEAADMFTVAPWMMIFPGVFLLLTTLAFNLVGDGLRDALDPRTAR